MSFAIRAKGLGKCYQLYEKAQDRLRELVSPTRRIYHREFWALRDLDLEIGRGECVGLVGVNGAGKSTALKLLAGKLRPSAGTIEVNGRLSSILELGTGFQPHLTGRQNALVNGLFLGLRPWETERHVATMLEFAELEQYADQQLVTYSSGMQARLAFASLVTLDPEILILDEALATGDARFAAKGQEYVRKLCRSGCTTIIASHDSTFLEKTCDRVVWIDKGKKRAEGSPDTVVTQYLHAVGVGEASGGRPAGILMKIEAADPAAAPAFHFLGTEWLDGSGKALSYCDTTEDASWRHALSALAGLGFTGKGPPPGWGERVEKAGRPWRLCTPREAGGAVHLGLVVPPAPAALPRKLRIGLLNGASCDAVFSLMVNGRFHEVARGGGGGVDPKMLAIVVDLGDLVASGAVPAEFRAETTALPPGTR